MWCCWSLFPDGEWVLRFIHSMSFEIIPLVIPIIFQMEEEPFNPDYVEVDRVLEVSYCEDKDTGEVKWIVFHLLIILQLNLCIFNSSCALEPFLLSFFYFVGAVCVFSAYQWCLCISEVLKAILIGLLAAFVNIIKTEFGLALLIFSIDNSPLPFAGGGLLPGEVVFFAIRGQHLGAKRWCGSK